MTRRYLLLSILATLLTPQSCEMKQSKTPGSKPKSPQVLAYKNSIK